MGRVAALLVNIRAGRDATRTAARTAVVRRGLKDAGFDVEVRSGGSAAGSVALAVEAVAGAPAVLVALGGDGTVHCALQAVAGTPVPLAIVPAGTGNDIAASLGLPADPLAAVAAIAAGRVRVIDLGRAGGSRWWGGVLSVGFDSAVAERANRLRWPRGPRRYDVAVLAELLHLRAHPMTLNVDGTTEHADTTLVAVGNGPRYGGGFRICPAASLDDGLLDLTVVGPLSRIELMRIKPSVRTGGHLGHPAVRVLRAREIRLDAPGLVAYGDGERVGPLPLHLECVPAAVGVVVP